jgi:hypothetical protein
VSVRGGACALWPFIGLKGVVQRGDMACELRDIGNKGVDNCWAPFWVSEAWRVWGEGRIERGAAHWCLWWMRTRTKGRRGEASPSERTLSNEEPVVDVLRKSLRTRGASAGALPSWAWRDVTSLATSFPTAVVSFVLRGRTLGG